MGSNKSPILVTLEFDPEEMSRRGRLGAAATHSRHDGRLLTAPGRAAFLRRFEHEVDPDGELPQAERQRQVDEARRAYFSTLGRKSAQARASRVDAKGGAS